MHLFWHKAKELVKIPKDQRREFIECRQSSKDKDGPPSKRQRFSREESRDKETQILVSKLFAKELGNMKKAEEKEEVKGKELKSQVMVILEEVKNHKLRFFCMF